MSGLLIFIAVMFDPTSYMAPGWITVGPVNGPTFGVPLILPREKYGVTFP